MSYLSDDPTYPVVFLGLAAVGCLVMLKVTQQGKYLISAGVVLLVLLGWMGIERAWVTDHERIEDVIYRLAAAVEASNADLAADFLTPDCVLEPSNDTNNIVMSYVANHFGRGAVTRERLNEFLPQFTFDWVKVVRMETHVSPISRLGTADCVVHAMAMGKSPTLSTPPAGMGWSFGLVEVSPKVWKVSRISPGRINPKA